MKKYVWFVMILFIVQVVPKMHVDSGIHFQSAQAWADDNYNFTELTPAIKRALERRRARHDTLRELKANGSVGEGKSGHLVNLSGSAKIQAVVDDENYDREIIYQAIVDQNNLGRGSIDTVRSAYAQTYRKKADPGDKIQMPNGDWINK